MTHTGRLMKRFALCMFLALAAGSYARAQKTVVIANRSTHADQMSQSEVRDIFTGSSTRFSNGTQAVPVILRGGLEQDSFLKDFIGKLDSSFRNGWRSLVFSGQATMVKTVDDDTAMLAYVANTPGAIGYVSKASPRDNVITVTVR
jgi:ABC-type phosphate transport system substrate-binding protein